MKKFHLAAVLIVSLAFSYGVRPGFDIGLGWQHLSWDVSDYYYDEDLNLSAFGVHVGTTVPYSRVVGLHAEIFGIRIWHAEEYDDDLTEINMGGRSDYSGQFGIGGQIGLVEMIPARSVSPYFRQYFGLFSYSSGGSTSTNIGLGIGAGAEFMSNAHVSPFVEANFDYTSLDAGYESISMTGFSLRGGVRLSWKK
ncbi:hypothetical protein AMJ87_07355 [candidate division WOR_3 bacterium SM23_60]|uniref:Outer membrane protein beta-barrel domain-containing protein n=1 Tax=candidate division WOR_3 bacterium SM23_60 TaxID=1703780 RepID=A0A0S8GEC0_UNCW3|nr:MAG: hypothetical protein AMJ87_07355 [candidate division WOR_3 bacterium SM23_60]